MKLLRSHTHGDTCPGGWFFGSYSLGLERTTIQMNGDKYLGRWILYVGGFTLRLHRFFRGDDARAPHDHPWTFWTFPLCRGYVESILNTHGTLTPNWVPGWRWSRRPSSYMHIVAHPRKPFYTIVVTLRKDRSWGFWPQCDVDSLGTVRRLFVPWSKWK